MGLESMVEQESVARGWGWIETYGKCGRGLEVGEELEIGNRRVVGE